MDDDITGSHPWEHGQELTDATDSNSFGESGSNLGNCEIFRVGDKVIIYEDGQPQLRRVAEVSMRSIKRQKRPVYLVQTIVTSRKRAKKEDWCDGTQIRRATEAEVATLGAQEIEDAMPMPQHYYQQPTPQQYWRPQHNMVGAFDPLPTQGSQVPYHMIQAALTELQDEGGSSLDSIQRYIESHYPVDPTGFVVGLAYALEQGVSDGKILRLGKCYQLRAAANDIIPPRKEGGPPPVKTDGFGYGMPPAPPPASGVKYPYPYGYGARGPSHTQSYGDQYFGSLPVHAMDRAHVGGVQPFIGGPRGAARGLPTSAPMRSPTSLGAALGEGMSAGARAPGWQRQTHPHYNPPGNATTQQPYSFIGHGGGLQQVGLGRGGAHGAGYSSQTGFPERGQPHWGQEMWNGAVGKGPSAAANYLPPGRSGAEGSRGMAKAGDDESRMERSALFEGALRGDGVEAKYATALGSARGDVNGLGLNHTLRPSPQRPAPLSTASDDDVSCDPSSPADGPGDVDSPMSVSVSSDSDKSQPASVGDDRWFGPPGAAAARGPTPLDGALQAGGYGVARSEAEVAAQEEEKESRAEAARKRKEDAERRRQTAAEARREAEEAKIKEEELRKVTNQLKHLRRKHSLGVETVAMLRQERTKIKEELAESQRKADWRWNRWEKQMGAKEEALQSDLKDDLQIIISEMRKRNAVVRPPLPPPRALTSDVLPARAVADVIEVCDFIRVHAPALRMKPFPVSHLLLALGVDSGPLLTEFRSLPTTSRSSAPDAFFLHRCLVGLLRVLFLRDSQTGFPLQGYAALPAEDKWDAVKRGWGNVLNPLTLTEVLRRYLNGQENKLSTAASLTNFKDSSGFSPFGESFAGLEENLAAAASVLKTSGIEDLEREHILSIMHYFIEELQDSAVIQQFILDRQEDFSRINEARAEAEKEMRRIQRELRKVQAASMLAVADATGAPVAHAQPVSSPEMQALQERLRQATDAVSDALAQQGDVEATFQMLRMQPLGEDRYYNQYWWFADEPRMYVHLRNPSVTGVSLPSGAPKKIDPPVQRGKGGEWGVYTDEAEIRQLLAALYPKTPREGKLLKALQGVVGPLLKSFQRVATYRQARAPPSQPASAGGSVDGSVHSDRENDESVAGSSVDASECRRSKRGRRSLAAGMDAASMDMGYTQGVDGGMAAFAGMSAVCPTPAPAPSLPLPLPIPTAPLLVNTMEGPVAPVAIQVPSQVEPPPETPSAQAGNGPVNDVPAQHPSAQAGNGPLSDAPMGVSVQPPPSTQPPAPMPQASSSAALEPTTTPFTEPFLASTSEATPMEVAARVEEPVAAVVDGAVPAPSQPRPTPPNAAPQAGHGPAAAPAYVPAPQTPVPPAPTAMVRRLEAAVSAESPSAETVLLLQSFQEPRRLLRSQLLPPQPPPPPVSQPQDSNTSTPTVSRHSSRQAKIARDSAAAAREPWRLPFEDAMDPLECFRRELLTIEREVREAIEGTTLLKMCKAARKGQREMWYAAVHAATHYSQLVQPLIEVEAMFAQSLGYETPLDESIKLYAQFIRKRHPRGFREALKQRPGVGGKNGAKGEGGTVVKREAQETGSVAGDDTSAAAMEVVKDEEGVEREMSERPGSSDSEGSDVDDEEEEQEEENEEDNDEDVVVEEEEAPVAGAAVAVTAVANGASSAGNGVAPAAVAVSADAAAVGLSPDMTPRKRIKLSGKATGPHKKGRSKTAIQANAVRGDEVDMTAVDGRASALLTPEERCATRELHMLQGPISWTGRQTWKSEVKGAQTASAMALCLYSFSSRAFEMLPTLAARATEVKVRERLARKSIKDDVEAATVGMPTKEVLEVVWARLPKGPYWPAVKHLPYRRSLRKLLQTTGQIMIRFIGETAVYHLRGGASSVYPYADETGRPCVEVLKRGKAMDKALRVAELLWQKQRDAKAAGINLEDMGDDDEGEVSDGENEIITADMSAMLGALQQESNSMAAPAPPNRRRQGSNSSRTAQSTQGDASGTDTDQEVAAQKAGRGRRRKAAGSGGGGRKRKAE